MANNLVLENARIIFRNFSGAEKDFNPAGRRNFSVVIDEELANVLRDDGWNVRPLRKRNPDDPTEPNSYHLPVAVTFGKWPPKVYSILGKRMVQLDESNVGELDYADLENVDLIIRPRPWEGRNGEHAIKAYLKVGYFTLVADELSGKYESFARDDEDVPF